MIMPNGPISPAILLIVTIISSGSVMCAIIKNKGMISLISNKPISVSPPNKKASEELDA